MNVQPSQHVQQLHAAKRGGRQRAFKQRDDAHERSGSFITRSELAPPNQMWLGGRVA